MKSQNYNQRKLVAFREIQDHEQQPLIEKQLEGTAQFQASQFENQEVSNTPPKGK